MKVKISFRVKGTHRIMDLIEVNNTKCIEEEVQNVEDFIEKFPPEKTSDNLVNAIKKAYQKKTSLSYHIRNINGNAFIQFGYEG